MQDQELFDRNLAALQEYLPYIGGQLAGYRPQSHLVFDEDGEPDVEFRGMRLYGQGALKYNARALTETWQFPHRFLLAPLGTDHVDSETNDFLIRTMRRAVDAGMSFKTHPTTLISYHLVVLGIGLGLHLDALIDRHRSRNIMLAEVNLEFLYQSLFVYDWQALIARCKAEGRAFNIIIADSPEEMALIARSLIKSSNPVSVDGAVVLVHYPHPCLLASVGALDEQVPMMLSGFGFLEDELNMMSNVYANLEDGTARVLKAQPDKAFALPALVVGSGGSLDHSIEDVRRLADRSLVIACGTALRPLLKEGIQPDIHIELERNDIRCEILTEVVQGYDVSDIWLVGSSTVWPEMRKLFPKRLYYFRPALSPYRLFGFGPSCGLRLSSPTVTNAALCFAQAAGCRQIYFFGVDMGVRDPNRHHSRHAWQYTQSYESGFREGWEIELPANFGGRVHTNAVLQWAHDELELAIRTGPAGRSYFNCSDGARISGSKPLLPGKADFPPPPRPKRDLVEALMASYPLYTREEFVENWADGKLYDDIEEAAVELIDVIERRRRHLGDQSHLAEIMGAYAGPGENLAPEKVMMRGTVYMILMTGEYYLSRLEQTERREELLDILAEEYIRAFEELGANTCARLREMIDERVEMSRRAAAE